MIKTIGDTQYKVTVRSDEGFDRKDSENIGTLITQHRRYDFSDIEFKNYGSSFEEDFYIHINDIYNIVEIEDEYNLTDEESEAIGEFIDNNIVYNIVSITDHSGVSIYTGTGRCQWDSGQVGYIYAHIDKIKDLILKEGEDGKEKLDEILKQEIKDYDRHINNDYYDVEVEQREIIFRNGKEYYSKWEQLESIGCLDKASDILEYVDIPFTKEEIDNIELDYY